MLPQCLYLLLVLGALVVPADAINCYVCDSLEDDGCGDPFGSSVTKAGCGHCSKNKATGSSQGIARDCESSTIASNGCVSQTSGSVRVEICSCDSNLCNTASTPVAYIPILLVAFALMSTKTFMY